MPKRIGFLYEKMTALDNCILAEKRIRKNKPGNRMAQHIAKNAERYGRMLHERLVSGTVAFHPNRETDITDSYKNKTRHLKIPCLADQAVELAWLNIATPYIERRNYYYNCGSIPGAGQKRAIVALKKWVTASKARYAVTADIRKFYDTCPHWVVMRGLRRIFKDERFLALPQLMLENMSPDGVGIAIGHPVSHWLANVAVMEIDHELRRRFPDVRFVRYMDNYAMICNNKRHLRRAFLYLREKIEAFGMQIKRDWQLFRIRDRGLSFLSYRVFVGYTLLAKRLMFRIAHKMKRAKTHMSVHMAMGVMSYFGILKYCNSYRFRKERVYPYTNKQICRRMISNAAKNQFFKATAPV